MHDTTGFWVKTIIVIFMILILLALAGCEGEEKTIVVNEDPLANCTWDIVWEMEEDCRETGDYPNPNAPEQTLQQFLNAFLLTEDCEECFLPMICEEITISCEDLMFNIKERYKTYDECNDVCQVKDFQ